MIGNLRKLILTLTVVLIATLGLCGSSFGWLNKTALTVDGKVKQATVIRQYFHTGDGSEEDPYVITRPIHFYHLVELYQRKNTVVAGKYFQLGYDLDPTKEGLEVYEYDDLGNVVMEGNTPKTCTTLNMAYYSNEYALIPVGTSVMPFDGHFEGSGLEIENINIRAAETISTSEHFASSDIGIFGYVNGDADISNVYFNNVHIDLTGCDASQTLPGHNTTHHNNGVVYVGYLAGHVMESISIQNVFLNNCTIVGAESVATGTTVAKNLYGYIGCVENNDTTLVETLGESIATQFGGGGKDPGWGNTVNMKNMYNRLYAIARAHRNDDDVMYPSVENLVVEVDDSIDPENPPANFAYTKVISRDVVEMDDTVGSHSGYRLNYVHHGNDIAGSYYFNTSNGYSPWIYLTGRNQYQTKTVNVYISKDVAGKVAYFICDTDAKNYMSASTSKTITNTTKTDATRWMIDGDNHLYTLIGATQYYLNASGLSLVLSNVKTGATQWTIDEGETETSSQIYAIQDGSKYYVNFDEVWQLSAEVPNYSICDGNGHYIGLNGSDITTADSVGTSASWIKETSSQGIKFSTYVNGIPMYLAFVSGEGLTLSPTTFSWTQEGSAKPYSYTTESDGKKWYLAYDGEWKAVVISGKNIMCEVGGNEHYLSADASFEGVTSGSPDAYTSLWDMDTTVSSTTIELPYDGVSYSLDADVASGDVYLRVPTATASATEWHKDPGGNYYVQKNSAPFYLTYDGKWCVKTSSSSFIKSGTHYLAFDSTRPYNVGDSTSTAGNTSWVFENPGGTGLVYINVEGTAYYLNIRTIGGQPVVTLDHEHPQIINDDSEVVDPGWSTADAVRWTGDSKGYYAAYDNAEYYLRYESGWVVTTVDYRFKAVGTVSDNYLAHQKNGDTYSVYNYKGTDTSNANVIWKSDGKYIWFMDNGTRHYLAFGSEGGVAVISDTPCQWKSTYKVSSGETKNILNTEKNGVHYRLDYEGGSWVTTSLDIETVLFTDNYNSSTGYLCVQNYTDGTRVKRTADATEPKAHWIYEGNYIYQYYGGEKYYLYMQTATGTGYKCLFISRSQKTYWQDDEDFPGAVYTTFCGIRHVIYNNNSSMMGLAAAWKVIYSGDHYLCSTTKYNGVTDGDSTNDYRDWYFYHTGDTPIYTMSSGVQYYLQWTGSKLTLTKNASDSGTTWDVGDNAIYTQDGYTLTYVSGTGWTCTAPKVGWAISDGTNYLVNNNGSFSSTTDPYAATVWTFSNESSLGNDFWEGTIKDGNKYLAISSSGNLTTSSSSYTWHYSNGGLHENDDNPYWLKYDNGWKIVESSSIGVLLYYAGSDGKLNYMASTFGSTQSKSSAVELRASSIYQSDYFDGCYLYGNITDPSLSSGKYLGVSYSDAQGKYALTFGSEPDYSWNSGSSDKGMYLRVHVGFLDWRNYYIVISNSGAWGVTETSSQRSDVKFMAVGGSSPTYLSLKQPGASYKVDYRDKPDTLNKVSTRSFWYGTETSTSYIPSSGFAEVIPSVLELNPIEISNKILDEPTEEVEEKTVRKNSRILRTTAQTLYGPYTRTNQYSGYDTYIPLRLKLQDEEDETSYYSDYRIDSRNTGYIVSGAYQTSGGYRADIRVSNYDTSDIYKALNVGSGSSPNYSSTYDSRLSVITKTAYSNGDNKDGTGGTGKVYGDNGYVRILDEHNKLNIDNYHSSLPDDKLSYKTMGLEKYESYTDSEGEKVKQSRDALADMLTGGNDIYGLHFMESTISIDHIIYADHATILGNTYQNYELPEDSIDFKVKERGAINFFAGTYYSDDVETFFSLHHILRDGNQHITAIKEIKKIYQKGTKSYVYLYGDGTYSDGSSGPESGAKMVFDTTWITNPTIQQNALYYFEIPVNRGEYALGSVPNKVGAYLMYLDIATHGGDVTESRISSEGSGVSNLFKIDYRDAGGTLDGTSLIQFEINAPAENPSSSGEEYTVDMKYETVTGSTIEGLYTLTITNRTGEDLDLTVFVCDNDNIRGNDYPYAYTVKYISGTSTTPVTLVEQAQTCDIYVVPH